MWYRYFSFLLIHYFFCIAAYSQARTTVTLNENWLFNKSNAAAPPDQNLLKGTTVNLPHTWNATDVLRDGEPGYYRGSAWYVKELDGLNPRKIYYLKFEGANQLTEVFVNNKKAGIHTGGYTAFTINITPYLESGTNVIAVRVDNSYNADVPPLSGDFTFFGGIYRDVYLIEAEPVHFDISDSSKGIYIHTPKVSDKEATVKINAGVLNTTNSSFNANITCTVTDSTGKPVAKKETAIHLKPGKNNFEESLIINNPKLWSPDMPYCYTAEFAITRNGTVLDEDRVTIGVRTFSFNPDTGFHLSGKPLKLMGANRHQDFTGLGTALTDNIHRADLKLLKDMGANFVRLAHYPQDPAVLEAADRLGLLVWEEIPLVNEITLSPAFSANAHTMLKEMIKQHYNHPSVIIWGYMNEIYWQQRYMDSSTAKKQTHGTITLAKSLDSLARATDPLRYTAIAMHHDNLYEESGLADIPQIAGWNLYNGWYYEEFEDFGKFLDTQHLLHPERVHIVSEFGAGGDVRLHSTQPQRFDHTMEGQKRMLESFLHQIAERPFLAGATVWNLADFSSENRRDTSPHFNNKGIVTDKRAPKDTYYLFQAYLVKQPFIKIAETNWTERAGSNNAVLPIDIYTNLKEVELYHNEILVGRKNAVNKKATWDIAFNNGINKFTARGTGAHITFNDALTINYTTVQDSLTVSNSINISINAGSNASFYDESSTTTWLADKHYTPGGWGYTGGKPLYIGGKPGTLEEIINSGKILPVYQTMHEGADAYKFDVKDGWYELELLFAEPYPKSRNFAISNSALPADKGNKRVFDVIVNGKTIISKLDLLKTYGYSHAISKKIIVKAQAGKGITVAFRSYKDKSIISGLQLRSIE